MKLSLTITAVRKSEFTGKEGNTIEYYQALTEDLNILKIDKDLFNECIKGLEELEVVYLDGKFKLNNTSLDGFVNI